MAEVTCSRDGCERPALTKGLCKSHYTLHRRNHPDRPRCSVDGCDRARVAKEVCERHYQQGPGRDVCLRANRNYADRNREVMAAKYREWFAANPEKRRASRRRWMAEWRAKNPEAARAAALAWIAANPQRWRELQRTHGAIRRAREAGTKVEAIDLGRVLAEHGMTCHICGDAIPSLSDLHFDHVIPLARGGTHTYDNIRPSHARCNLRKGARLPP